MSGETPSNSNEQSSPQAEQWQSLQPSSMTDEQKQLIQEGIYGLDGKPTEEYLESRAGQKATAVEEKFNQSTAQIGTLLANLDEQVTSGAITPEQAQKYRQRYLAKQEEALNKAIEQIDSHRQDYIDGKQIGTPEEDWIDDSKVYSRDEVLAAQSQSEQGATAADEQAKETAATSEAEKILADEKEKLAALEAEKSGTFLEDAENLSRAGVEANLAEHRDAIKNEISAGTHLDDMENLTRSETEARLAEHQAMLSKLEASSTDQTEAPDPNRQEVLENENKNLRLELAERELSNLRLELAELFVKKNRILGSKHRAEYNEAREKYEEALENYLNLKSKTDEELFQNYLEEDNKLLEDVDNQIDNGNFFRKIISRTLGNDYYKQAMHAHGARSLGVAGAESVKPAPKSQTITPEPTTESVSQPEPSPAAPTDTPETPSPETSTSTPENPADINVKDAAKQFDEANEAVRFSPDYYGPGSGAIITDTNPAELNFPDGWYYAKGNFRNKYNTSNPVYDEIPMIKSDGTMWPSTFSAGNTPSSESQS